MQLVVRKATMSFILIVILLVMPFISKEGRGVGAPVIQISLDSYRGTAYVAPGQDGIVTFTGTVTAQVPYQPDIQYLIVYLECDAGGWPVTTPPEMMFTNEITEQSFQVQVKVPMGTSSTGNYSLTIGGTWRYSPGALGGTISTISAVIIVDQFYDFDIGCREAVQEAERSETARFLLNVEHVRHRLRFLLISVKQGVQSVCFMIGVTTCNSRRQSSSVSASRPKGALGRHESESSLLFCREAVGDCARVGFFVCSVLNPAVRRAFILE